MNYKKFLLYDKRTLLSQANRKIVQDFEDYFNMFEFQGSFNDDTILELTDILEKHNPATRTYSELTSAESTLETSAVNNDVKHPIKKKIKN